MPSINTFAGIAAGLGGLASAAGSIVAGQGQAAADRTQAAGFGQEASFYGQASDIAGENVLIQRASTRLQQYANLRQLKLTEAAGENAYAVNGFSFGATGGTPEYIMRMNAAQGGIAGALIGQQGAIQENVYQTEQYALQAEQAQALAAQQQAEAAAKSASGAGFFGALGDIFSAGAKAFTLFG